MIQAKNMILDERGRNNYLIIVFTAYYFLMIIASAIGSAQSALFNQVLVWGGSPLVLIIFLIHYNKSKGALTSESIRLMVFLLFVLQSRYYSDNTILYDKAFRKVLLNISLFVIAEYIIYRTGGIKIFFTATLIGITFLCIYIMVFVPAVEQSTIDYEGFKIENEAMNTNGLANFAVEGILAFLFFWYKHKRKLLKYLSVIAFFVFIVTIIGAASKAGFIGLLTATSFWVLFCIGSNMKDKLKLLGIVLVFTLSIFVFAEYVAENTYLGERINKVGNIDEYYENDTRGQLIEFGLNVFYENPILGAGLMQVAARHPRGAYTHNEYVEILSNFGIVGAIIYFPFMLIIWKRIQRTIRGVKNDTEYVYNLNFMQVIIVVLLVRGFSCPLFTGFDEMILFGVAGGYSKYCESQLKAGFSFNHRLATS